MTTRFSIAPGYHQNLPAADYHRFRAASASALKVIHAGTPAHLKREWDEPQDPTPAMQWGTALHWLVLEPQEPSPVAVTPETYTVPEDSKPKKDGPKPGESVPWNPLAGPCKDWTALQRAAGKIVMRPDEFLELRKTAIAVNEHPEAGPMLCAARFREATIVWEDARQVPCKARLDAIGANWEGQRFIVDLKTTTDASPAGFARKAWELGYHLQAAWYVDALAESRGCGTPAFYFVAVEKDSGLVSVHQATDAFLEAGREAYRKAMEQFAEAWHSGVWPGYPEEIHALDVPAWARKVGA